VNDVPRVNQPQSDPSVNRRSNSAVGQLQFLSVNLRLVGLDRSVELANRRLLRIELLACDNTFLPELLIAIEVNLRVVLRCDIFRELSLRLVERQSVEADL